MHVHVVFFLSSIERNAFSKYVLELWVEHIALSIISAPSLLANLRILIRRIYNDNVGWCNWYFDLNKGLCNQCEGLGGHPYHTECVSQLVDHFKAIKKKLKKPEMYQTVVTLVRFPTHSILNSDTCIRKLASRLGLPHLWTKTKLFPFFSFEDFPKEIILLWILQSTGGYCKER